MEDEQKDFIETLNDIALCLMEFLPFSFVIGCIIYLMWSKWS